MLTHKRMSVVGIAIKIVAHVPYVSTVTLTDSLSEG